MFSLFLYKNKFLLKFFIFLLLSTSFILINKQFPDFNLKTVVNFIIYPLQYAYSSFFSHLEDFIVNMKKINELEAEIEILKTRLLKYQEHLLLLNQIEEENINLRKLLDIKTNISYSSFYAKIIARDPTLVGNYIVINKGFRHGIRRNMAVVSFDENGELYLLGKVNEVNDLSSKVQLLTSLDSVVGVYSPTTGHIGILRGKGRWNSDCIVNYIPVEANINIGDKIVTSMDSEIFPPNIKIGEVIGISTKKNEEFFKSLYIKPYFNLTKLKDVFIINFNR